MEAVTKLPTFSDIFKCMFLEHKCLNFAQNCTERFSGNPVDKKSSFGREIAWHPAVYHYNSDHYLNQWWPVNHSIAYVYELTRRLPVHHIYGSHTLSLHYSRYISMHSNNNGCTFNRMLLSISPTMIPKYPFWINHHYQTNWIHPVGAAPTIFSSST